MGRMTKEAWEIRLVETRNNAFHDGITEGRRQLEAELKAKQQQTKLEVLKAASIAYDAISHAIVQLIPRY